MREIEFRAWDTVNKRMISSPMAICSGAGGWVLFTAEVEAMDCTKAIHPIQQYVIMQYIGIKDKNDKKIFEGDICLLMNTVTGMPYSTPFEVYFSGGDWGARDARGNPYDNGEYRWSIVDWKGCEIIGNIHDTPELLK